MRINDYLDCLFSDTDIIELRLLPEKNAPQISTAKSFLMPKNKLKEKITSKSLEAHMLQTYLFACIAINPKTRKSKNEITEIKNLVLDFDGTTPPQELLERANIICKRENNWHLYFCFEPLEPTDKNKKAYKDTARLLAKYSGADTNVIDATRVIRLPGLVYQKNGKKEKGYEILKIENTRKSFGETFSFLEGKKSKKTKKEKAHANDEKETQSTVSKKRIVEFLHHLYKKKGIFTKGNGRSKVLYMFGCDCHAWGLPIEDAIEAAKNVNKEICYPPESDDIVIHQVKSAYTYRKGSFGSYLDAFGTLETPHEVNKAIKQITIIHKIMETFQDWIYCHEAERLINTTNGLTFTSQNQCDMYIAQQVGEKVGIKYAVMHGAIKTVHKLDYRPDKEKFFVSDGLEYYNTYRAPKELKDSVDKNEAVGIFLNHLKYLTNNDKEFAWLLAWLAYIVQHKGKKVMWAPLIVSHYTGVGKSALIELLKNIFGDWNVSEVSSYDLIAQHTDYMAEKILVASHEVELAEKEAMHRLKNLITERKVRIVQKYARTYEATNCANFIFLSNRPDALKIDEEDRRLFVVYHNKPPKEQQYYTKLFSAIHYGTKHIYEYLMSLDLSNFDPHRRPPITEGKELMIANSESDLSLYLKTMRDERKGPFGSDFFQTHELVSYIQEFAPLNVKKFCTNRTVQLWLSKHGYKNHVIQHKIDNVWRKKCYWSDRLSKEEIAESIELQKERSQ